MAIDLGFLIQAATRGLAGYRRGQREEQDLQRQQRQEESARLFNEWARRQQLQQPMELMQLKEQIEAQNRERARQALLGLGIGEEKATAGAEMPSIADNLLPRPEPPFRGQVVQENTGMFHVIDPTKLGPTGVTGRLPGSGQGAGARPRELPSGAANEIGAARGLSALARSARQRAEALIKQGMNVSGPIVGKFGGFAERMLPGRQIPQEVVDLWSTLSNIGSREMLARSGAAVTPHEFARLEPHLPSQTDSEEQLLQKLDAFARELELILEHRMSAFEDAGYNMSRFRARDGSGIPDPPPADDEEVQLSDADLWEKKVDEGMSPQEATAYVRNRRRP